MTAQEIIEKIRAEIERQEKQCPLDTYEGRHKLFILGGLKTFLSDLEKEEKPMELDFEQELYKHFGQVKDFTLGMRIGQYFYELGCRRTAEKYDEIEYKRQRADVCEELEEEIDRFENWMETYNQVDYPTSFTTRDIARHFAQWQKAQMMKEAVEVEVTETCGISSVWIKTTQFKPGQKVKIIICKKED